MTEEIGKLYPVAKAVITPVFKAAWRFRVRGLEHVPDHGGAILCPNHTSVLDSFFVPALLPRRITYVGKAEYMDDWKTRTLFPALGMIPVDREGGDAGERALATAQRILEKGELFGIYPEGTRSRDGRLYRGHTGPARLAVRTGVPIIPIGIKGAREVMPPEAKVPKLRLPVEVTFGRPISVAHYAERAQDHLVLRQIVDEVMFEIRELSGQDYVDDYATKKKKKPEAVPEQDQAAVGEVGADGTEADDAAVTAIEKLKARRHPAPTNGSSPGDDRDGDHNEFVGATRPRSSAELLARPVHRTGA